MKELSNIRNVLAVIDFRLDDCMHILSGYSKTLADLAVQDSQPQPPSTGNKDAVFSQEQVAWVEQELKKLQEKKHESNPAEESG